MLTSLLTLPLALAAGADSHHTKSAFSYDYLEVDFVANEVDALDETGKGILVAGSADLVPYVNVIASFGYDTIDVLGTDLDTSVFSFGAGAHYPLHERVDIYGNVSFLHGETEGGGADRSETGFGFETGFRTMPVDRIEFDAALRYTDVFDSSTNLVLGARGYFTKAVSAGFSAVLDSGGNSYVLGLRYNW